LSGVEERDEEEEEASYEQSHDVASTYASSQRGDDTLRTEGEGQDSFDVDESLMDDVDISGSTPRAPRPSITEIKSKFADYESPYESLKEEIKGGSNAQEDDNTQIAPATPGTQSKIPNVSMTPESSPFDSTSYAKSATTQRKAADVLLHRVLDKNYRIQATPHKSGWKDKTPANKPSWRDGTPNSSPPVAAPQLHADIFSSPIRQQYSRPAPRTPGVSVIPKPAKDKGKEVFSKPAKKDEISWESDSDEDAEGVYRELGMSPPKTIQFSLPQSRLLQTPGKLVSY
jgi:DASH complex subunit ASK1